MRPRSSEFAASWPASRSFGGFSGFQPPRSAPPRSCRSTWLSSTSPAEGLGLKKLTWEFGGVQKREGGGREGGRERGEGGRGGAGRGGGWP